MPWVSSEVSFTEERPQHAVNLLAETVLTVVWEQTPADQELVELVHAVLETACLPNFQELLFSEELLLGENDRFWGFSSSKISHEQISTYGVCTCQGFSYSSSENLR